MRSNFRIFFIALLLSLATVFSIFQLSPITPMIDRSHAVVFGPEKAEEILDQCSREGSPENFNGSWTPTALDFIEMEKRILPYLENEFDKMEWADELERHPKNYYRQYVGILRGNRRMIYINAFHHSYLVSAREVGISRPFWRDEIVKVCDGGRSFFGVWYDVKTKKFLELAFNGNG